MLNLCNSFRKKQYVHSRSISCCSNPSPPPPPPDRPIITWCSLAPDILHVIIITSRLHVHVERSAIIMNVITMKIIKNRLETPSGRVLFFRVSRYLSISREQCLATEQLAVRQDSEGLKVSQVMSWVKSSGPGPLAFVNM